MLCSYLRCSLCLLLKTQQCETGLLLLGDARLLTLLQGTPSYFAVNAVSSVATAGLVTISGVFLFYLGFLGFY